MGVFVASFAATTLDTATRLQRYIVADLATAWKPIPLQQLKKFAVPIDSCYFSISATSRKSEKNIALSCTNHNFLMKG